MGGNYSGGRLIVGREGINVDLGELREIEAVVNDSFPIPASAQPIDRWTQLPFSHAVGRALLAVGRAREATDGQSI